MQEMEKAGSLLASLLISSHDKQSRATNVGTAVTNAMLPLSLERRNLILIALCSVCSQARQVGQDKNAASSFNRPNKSVYQAHHHDTNTSQIKGTTAQVVVLEEV